MHAPLGIIWSLSKVTFLSPLLLNLLLFSLLLIILAISIEACESMSYVFSDELEVSVDYEIVIVRLYCSSR